MGRRQTDGAMPRADGLRPAVTATDAFLAEPLGRASPFTSSASYVRSTLPCAALRCAALRFRDCVVLPRGPWRTDGERAPSAGPAAPPTCPGGGPSHAFSGKVRRPWWA
ncbi:hypothetical protein GCM10010385_51930 [Streptomyces geysiriensis]|nr:hypothetical protein GCM10010385_51930 [Streptomyces geysiriensis]